MKKILTAALGAAAIATSLLGAGTANADAAQDNYWFVQTLNNNNINVTNVSAAISHGHIVCSMLNNGATGLDAQRWLANVNPGLGWHDAYNEVGIATGAFCPSLNYLVFAPDSLA